MAIRRVNPLRSNVPIVDDKGNPTPMFQRLWQSLFLNDTEIATLDQLIAEIQEWEVVAGTGLDGGGAFLSNPTVTVDLANTAVTPGTYGDSTNVAQITVDQQGRITAASNVSITGGSGGARWFKGGISGQAATINTSARATKGVRITPDYDLTVDAVHAVIDQAAGADNYYAIIAELSDDTSTATVVSVVATTTPQSNGSTAIHVDRFPLPSQETLTAGTTYFVGVVFDQASGTAVARLAGNNGIDPIMMAPVVHHGRFFYNTVGLSASQSPDVAEDDASFFVYLEGTYTP